MGRDSVIAAVRWALRYVLAELVVLPTRVIGLALAAGLVVLPLVTSDPYVLRVFTLASILAIFGASWDLLTGFAGQVNLGHALFFGVAAYTSGLLNVRLGLHPWLTVPLGALAAVVVGLVVGIPCLRLRGPYLALATLTFPIILASLIFAFPDQTGGELGISGLTRLAATRVREYYLSLAAMFLLVFAMWKITDAKTGLLFHAIREDEIAARVAGINTTRYKLLAFSLSGLFAGLAGAMYAHFMRIAGPSLLSPYFSFQPIIWTIFGGMATIYGPVVGVFVLYPVLEILRVVPEVRMLGFGIMVVALLRFMPQGVVPWVRERLEQECPRCKAKNAFTRRACRICTASLGPPVGTAALRAWAGEQRSQTQV